MNVGHRLGNLTRDPEMRTIQSGKNVVNFTIAVNRSYKRGKETVKEVAFLNCEAWDTGAEMINRWFKKGDPIIIHESIRQDEWTDKDGKKRNSLKFRVSSFEFVPGHKYEDSGSPTPSPKRAQEDESYVGVSGDDNIPF